MAFADLRDVSLDYPIFDASARSLRKRLVRAATGGQLGSDQSGHVVVKALSDLTFSISSGERVGLVGHNGAGKTTILGVLSGIYAPTSGHVEIRGRVGSLIGLTLGTDAESTGRENILLRAALLGLSRREVEDRMEEIIAFSELGEFIDMPVRTYSSGMNLRLAFSVATVIRPDILLMDEWLSVGDSEFRGKAQKRLAEMVDDTKVLVLATHSKDLLLRQCTRALWLEHGTVRMDATPDEVAEAYFGVPAKFRGLPGSQGLAAQIKDYVRGYWPGTRLAFVDWEKIHGGAVSGLVELLERQGGFPRMPVPRNKKDEELQRCLEAAWKIVSPGAVDTEAEECLRGLEPVNAGEILAELVLYQNARRSSDFWIKALERAAAAPEIGSPLRARLAARLAVLRKDLAIQGKAGADRLRALNPLALESVRCPLDVNWEDTRPAPGVMIVVHEDRGEVLGESIVFRECSLTETMTVAINGRYFSAAHDAAGWIRQPAKLLAVAVVPPGTRVVLPAWYLDTPNDYLKFTQLIPSILLAAELGDESCRIFANLSKETIDQLKASAIFFGRGIPEITSLEPAAGNLGSSSCGTHLLVRAANRYIARLRAGAPSARWSRAGYSGKKIYLSAPSERDKTDGNETELLARLRDYGFEMVVAGVTQFAQEIEMLSEAQTLVAAPGPHLARMIFCSPECRFLELSGIGEPVSLYAQLAATCGIKSYQQLPLPVSAASWPELTNLL